VGPTQQVVEIRAKATKGTGREHARFCPVSQCSYEYTPDSDPQRIQEMFTSWLNVAKKASSVDKGSERYNELLREFNTMQVKRCYKINEKNEPFSFDFTVETAGVLPVNYIVERACEVGENMCSRYVNIHRGELPAEMTLSASDSRIIGFDFLIRGHDHTLGNLLQTWLVENHIQGDATPKVTYAGYSVPHPLRDEMILRIGVEDGEEATARLALAEAAKGCVEMFQKLRASWRAAIGAPALPQVVKAAAPSALVKSARRKTPRVAPPKKP
jgi:DNA-directed RNA polymerase subunit L